MPPEGLDVGHVFLLLYMEREIWNGTVDVDAVAGAGAAETARDVDRTTDVVIPDFEMTGQAEADPGSDSFGCTVGEVGTVFDDSPFVVEIECTFESDVDGQLPFFRVGFPYREHSVAEELGHVGRESLK